MKLRVKIPGGGYLEYEKKPMSAEARECLWMDVMFLSVIVSIWLLR